MEQQDTIYDEKADRKREKAKALWEYRKANHLCIMCGKKFADVKGRLTCRKCRGKQNARRLKLKKNKLCVECGQPLSADDIKHKHISCAKCRKWRRMWKHEHYVPVDKAAKKQARGEDITKCSVCGGDIDEPGYLCCSKCRAKAREQYWERKKASKQQESHGQNKKTK